LKLVLIITMAVVVLGISVSFISVQGQQDYDIPQWVKNNAGWWADDSIDDESFVNGITYLIDSGIMEINIDSTIQDQGDFYLTYKQNPNSPYVGDDTAIAWLKNVELLEMEMAFLNETFRLPYDVEIVAQECNEVNAFYDPESKQIVMCYELVDDVFDMYYYFYGEEPSFDMDEMQTYSYDVLNFIFFHEVGHALIDVYQLPITGLEENVADQFAALMLSYTYYEETGDYSLGQEMLYNVGTWFYNEHYYWNEVYPQEMTSMDNTFEYDIPYWGNHNLDMQRFYNISCYAYGSDVKYSQYLIDDGWLPEERAQNCEWEYYQMDRNWSILLKDFDYGFFD